MKKEETKKYYGMIVEAWELFRKCADATQEDCDKAVEEGNALYEKYNCKFMLELLGVMLKEIERRYDEQKGRKMENGGR